MAHRTTSPTGVSGLSLTKFLDPAPVPPVITVPAHQELWELQITMRTERATLHSQLPPTTVWTYNGSFPGPTIRVRRGQKLRVTWQNEITGNFPVTSVRVASATPFETPVPGRDGGTPRPEVVALPPWTVVHLHGARTGGGNDGWTENAVLPGNSQLAEYPNDQQATTLWYHDHAMAITALNVMTGLMGMYLICDEEEDALELPHGEHEVPLIICDRNFDTDADGNLTGELLHKAHFLPPPNPENRVLPFLGPFTLVNGVIWPHLEVDARWVQFRVLNASNWRFYQFELRDEDDAPIPEALCLIGTDGGLLGKPVKIDQLTLAPAERADILINFGAFPGKRLRLVNTRADAPFEPGTTTRNPDIMQFRVRTRSVQDPFTLPSMLSPSFVPLTHDTLPEHHHRWLVLTLLHGGTHPEMWEMVELEEPLPSLPADGIVQVMMPGATKPTTLQRVGRTFKDAANFYIQQESWEQWRILNLSAVVHPIHLHLVQFQVLSRQLFDVTGFDPALGGTTTPVTYVGEGMRDPSERGWKDTIRVGGSVVDGVLVGELVSIIGQFGGASGRFMYHCHILEHEDEGMMSTFVVMPNEIIDIDPHMSVEPHHPTPRQTTLWDDHSRYVGPPHAAVPPDQPR
ncbi:MAG: multicopper oxidase family protein [Egibacteraceae bacterium]